MSEMVSARQPMRAELYEPVLRRLGDDLLPMGPDPENGKGVAVEHILQELNELGWLSNLERYYLLDDEAAALDELLAARSTAAESLRREIAERSDRVQKERDEIGVRMRHVISRDFDTGPSLRILRELLRGD